MGPRRPSGSRSCPHGFLVGRPIIIARVALGKRVVPELPGRRPPDGPAGAALTHERRGRPGAPPPPPRPRAPPPGAAEPTAAAKGPGGAPPAKRRRTTSHTPPESRWAPWARPAPTTL